MRRIAVFACATSVVAGTLVAGATSASARPAQVPLSHPVWAKPSARVGPVAAASQRTVRVYLRMRDASGARELAAAVSNPRSNEYTHYLSPAQVRARYAPTKATVGEVSRWLRSAGLHVGDVPANSAFVPASGSTRQVERAFHVTLNRYRVARRDVVGADRAASVPASVADDVLAVAGLNQTVATHAVVAPPAGFRNAGPCSVYFGEKTDTTDPPYNGVPLPYAPCGYKPAQLRSAYGIDTVLDHGVDGSGVTVAIVDAFGSPTAYADASTYAQRNDATHPLTPAQYSETVAPPTPGYEAPDQCNAAGWYGEQALDIEAVHAVAPGANIHYYGAADCLDASLDAQLNAIVANHSADVVSDSWGSVGETNPAEEVQAFEQIAEQAAIEGIGFYFSSGDAGDEAANLGFASPDFPASDPWVTAVGGTSLQIGADGQMIGQSGWETARSVLTNGAWGPASFTSGAGGGTSRVFPQPTYQTGVVPDALAMSGRPDGTRGRVVPDVASVADPNTGFLIGITQTFPEGALYDQYRIGGTSLAAPIVTATMALADDLDGVSHGFASPALYQMTYPQGGIDDVVPGGGAVARIDYANRVDASDGLVTSARTFDYSGLAIHTTAGYDDVTGLGTLHSGVALALDSLALTPSNPSTAAGRAQSFTATAKDGFGASTDQTAHTVLSIAPSGGTTGAQCTANQCTATAAGVYTITATYQGPLPTKNGAALTASTTLTVTPAAPAAITATGGTPQTATAGANFAQPLQATVVDAYGNPVAGATVSFALPAATATTGGASFPGGALTATAVTNSQGVATSPTVTAGPQTGTVDATATVGTLTADYTLAVTAAGPARADLSVTVKATSQVRPGQNVTVTVTLKNAGPSPASRVGTYLLAPRGWKIANAGGAAVRRGSLLVFTAATLSARGSITYSIVLTTTAQRQIAVIPAVTLSATQDPTYRNNIAAAGVLVR